MDENFKGREGKWNRRKTMSKLCSKKCLILLKKSKKVHYRYWLLQIYFFPLHAWKTSSYICQLHNFHFNFIWGSGRNEGCICRQTFKIVAQKIIGERTPTTLCCHCLTFLTISQHGPLLFPFSTSPINCRASPHDKF